jgi:uncharacterized protein (UPF0332 family)
LTADEKKFELAKYRIKQAEESLEEARFLLSGEKSSRSIINRAYYAMFYSVLALLVFEDYSSSKHSGVLSYFNKHFIKEGVFPESLGRSINKAFEVRQRGDYREYSEPRYEQTAPIIEEAELFIITVNRFLNSNNFTRL